MYFTYKMHKQALDGDKGYFIIEETNFSVGKEDKYRFRDSFDLNKLIGFIVHGEDNVILNHVIVMVDEKKYVDDKCDGIFFSCDQRFNRFVLDCKLTAEDLLKEFININQHLHRVADLTRK